MISARQGRTLFDGLSSQLIEDYAGIELEGWMKRANEILDDDDLVDMVARRLQERRPNSRTRGREGTPAEVVLRMLVLKHVKNWSFATLEWETRSNLAYREFTRVRDKKVPDEKTMVRARQVLGPETMERINARLVQIAVENKVARGRKMRVDTTVVETNVSYPTDSKLLWDGLRTITRKAGQIKEILGDTSKKMRNRLRSAKRQVIDIAKAARARSEQSKEKKVESYKKLLVVTRKVVKEGEAIVKRAKRRARAASSAAKRATLLKTVGAMTEVIVLTRTVIEQTRARVIKGNTHYEGKVTSIFEPQTEIIRRGKAGKPTEFGKMIKIQEAERQIITSYEVFDTRPADSEILMEGVEAHKEVFGSAPDLLAADAGFFSADNITAAAEAGVRKVCIPNKKGKSADEHKRRRQRWFRAGQRWRVGCEGRISVLKRRHGMNRSRYRGMDGMKCWVGLSVFSDNLINISKAMVETG
jgi:IS5 family transposase